MHAVRNQPQGIIEMPGDHHCFSSSGISDQDQTLAKTLQRLAQGEVELSLAESTQERGKLLSDDLPPQVSGLEIIFVDSVRLEHELATEMAALLEKM